MSSYESGFSEFDEGQRSEQGEIPDVQPPQNFLTLEETRLAWELWPGVEEATPPKPPTETQPPNQPE